MTIIKYKIGTVVRINAIPGEDLNFFREKYKTRQQAAITIA